MTVAYFALGQVAGLPDIQMHNVRSEMALEFSFDSEALKSVVVDEAMARRHLGEVTTLSLFSLIADMKEAMFLGEIADIPRLVAAGPDFRLSYALGLGYELEVQPIIGPGSGGAEPWRGAYRVKLLRILLHKDTVT